ncbi:MAG TPA: hypothetical protein DCW29_11100 [Janthinobacterium sp.]|nr:hypothetical protein [Janthinobacterium sp.]
MLSGAIACASLIVSLFFLRFWRSTRDRFFLYFAISFALEACGRLLIGSGPSYDQKMPAFYLIRLVAYLLILIAIVDKNRRG